MDDYDGHKNSDESEEYGKTSTPPYMENYLCYVGGWGTTEEGSQSDVFKSVNSMYHVLPNLITILSSFIQGQLPQKKFAKFSKLFSHDLQ